jgi:hypothetical protein
MKKLIILLAVFSGCTNYRFTPPTDIESRHCIVQCDSNRQMCLAMAGGYYICDSNYRDCYQFCGGKVEIVE